MRIFATLFSESCRNLMSGFDVEELEAEVTGAIGEYDNEIGVVTFLVSPGFAHTQDDR